MTVDNPFEVLDCPPTLDRDAVKKAYFRALTRHPPQTDPAGFRRVRAAYEQLTTGGLERAYLTSPLDLDRELTRYRERFDRALTDIGEARRQDHARHAELTSWFDRLSRCNLDAI